jgi:putative acetyltransferase
VTGLRIQAETSRDKDAIAQVTTAAFGRPSEARIIEAIRRTDGFVPELSLVAEVEGRVVGHVLLSYVELGANSRVLELAR